MRFIYNFAGQSSLMQSRFPVVILPVACLPDIEFFSWLLHAPSAIFEINETFPKQTCRNRYRIATANGPLLLSIPVVRPDGNHTPTSGIGLEPSGSWARIHWRAIESAYNKSPFFLYYRDDLEKVFNSPPALLVDFNFTLLKLCCRFTGISPDFRFTESYVKKPANMLDLRQSIMPKHLTEHPSPIRQFEPYIQVFSDRQAFIPNLSILDLLFNLGPEAGDYLKRQVPENLTGMME